jgi:adenine-specific DNA-methyltransferase
MAKKASRKKATKKTVETLTHADSKRTNIPTAEQQSVMETEEKYSIRVAYERRNRDLDPQLVWRGKDEQDAGPLVANAPPLYIQEKVHPKVLIDDLMRRTDDLKDKGPAQQLDLFGDFNGLPEEARSAEFYQHDANWTNRMILGDSLQVMASLAEREGLRGKVQCIYFDPPYGIKFNSNFQWSTRTQDVKDGKVDHITREPEQVKAFRDTWKDGIHSYLAYLRDRVIAARDLLSETGSIFIQIGDDNVHRVRAIFDEVFGEENFVSQVSFLKTSSATTNSLASTADYLIWYARDSASMKYRPPGTRRELDGAGGGEYRSAIFPNGQTKRLSREEIGNPQLLESDARVFRLTTLTSQSPGTKYWVEVKGRRFFPSGYWKTDQENMKRLIRADRIIPRAKSLGYLRYFEDYPFVGMTNTWTDTRIAGRPGDKIYVVQTLPKVVQRCILMTTDPGDLVLDPTCGSGTAAFVSEDWGRRWITIDTSRVALALARSRIMSARFPFYLLADSKAGKRKEAELNGDDYVDSETSGNIREGLVCERVPHITLKSIANNAEIDVIYEQFQAKLEPIREELNSVLGESWEEWEIPREAGQRWDDEAVKLHASLLEHRRRLKLTLEVLESVELAEHVDSVREIVQQEAAADLNKLNEHLKENSSLHTSLFKRYRAKRGTLGPTKPRNCMPNGGSSASNARRRSTLRSPPRPTLNTCTTNRTKTKPKSASPALSRSNRSPPTAPFRSVKTTN